MNNLEAIDKRSSRRTYSKVDLSLDETKKIFELIHEINKESSLTIDFLMDASLCFDGLKSYGMFTNVRSLIVVKGDHHLKDLYEKCGYYGEKIVLELTKLELGTCWVGGTYNKNMNVLNIANNEELVCVIVVGKVNNALSIKEQMIRKGTHIKHKSISEIGDCDTEMPPWFIKGIECVQKAPTALNSMKVKFELKDKQITAYVPNDYRFDLVDLGICKYHFELGSGYRLAFGNNGSVTIE